MKKKLLSLLLVAAMLLSALPIFAIGAFAADENAKANATNHDDLYVQDGLLTMVTTYGLLAGDKVDALTDANGTAIKLIATDETKAANASATNGGLLLGANTTLALDGVIPVTETDATYTYQFVFEIADIEPANKTLATESQFSWEGAYAARPVFTAGPLNVMVEPISKDAAANILENSKSQYIFDGQFSGGVAKTYIQLYDYWHSDYDRTNKMPRLMTFDYGTISALTFEGNTSKSVRTQEGLGEGGTDLVTTTYSGAITKILQGNTEVYVNPERYVQNQNYTALSNSIVIGNDFPMVLYSVRAYDRELSVTEINQNHFADIASKFNLKTTYFSFLSDYGKQTVYSTFAGIDMNKISATDAQDLLDSTIDMLPASYRYSYDNLFVSDGLVANLNFDTVSSDDLCDTNQTEFKNGDKVIAQFLPYSDAASDKHTWTYGDRHLKTGLNGAIDMSCVLDGLDEFTVQTTMAHNSATDDELFSTAKRPAIDSLNNTKVRVSAVHVGLLRFQFKFNAKQSSKASGGVSGTLAKLWSASQEDYFDTALSFDGGTAAEPELLAHALNAPFDFSVSQSAAKDGKAVAAVYNMGSKAGEATINVPAEGELLPLKSLVYGALVNTSIYSVRVYDRVLTDAEYKQNHFADIARYFRVSLALFNKMSDTQKAAVYEAFANVAISDASLTVESIEAKIADIFMQTDLQGMASLLVSFKGFQMATTDDVAFRPLFAVENAILAFAENGAKVSLGVVSAPAGTKDVKVTADASGIKASSGATLTEVYTTGAETNNFVYSGNSVSRFASAISPEKYDAEYVFRAYAVIEMNGTFAIAYCDTASNIFGTTVSAAELAAYFYAEGYTTGGIKTVYDAINAK